MISSINSTTEKCLYPLNLHFLFFFYLRFIYIDANHAETEVTWDLFLNRVMCEVVAFRFLLDVSTTKIVEHEILFDIVYTLYIYTYILSFPLNQGRDDTI